MGEERDDCGFMELLSCEDVVFESKFQDTMLGFEEQGFLFSPPQSCSLASSPSVSTAMLHFGGRHEDILLFHNDSSSTKKLESANGGKGRRVDVAASPTTVTTGNRKPRARTAGTTKVRKEKVGERIQALQQLVSPFGKTDTASVLHEAIGYIRFLHDQVKVLSSAYLQQLPTSTYQNVEQGGDLRSRGLCLVPVSCTEEVGVNNGNIGADFWSAAAAVGGSSSSSSGSKH